MPADPIRLILNGKFAEDPRISRAIEAARARGARLELFVTRGDGDASRLAAEATRAGRERVVAFGGDGTVNEVVCGQLGESTSVGTALGIVPSGSANDFACGCGIPLGDPTEALRLALEAPAIPIDLGRINGSPFLNSVSFGFGAEVVASTPTLWKSLLGGAAYSLQALALAPGLTPQLIRFVSGGEVEEFSLFLMVISNGCLAGGGYRVAERACLDDGRLDVKIVLGTSLTDLPSLFSEWQAPDNPANRHVFIRLLEAFRIEADDDLDLTIDGNPTRGREFNIEVLPRALRVALPPQCTGLRGHGLD